ncbi:MAG: mechanosensitive ion channel [Alistipes sp.]
MQKIVQQWIDALLGHLGFDAAVISGVDQWVAFASIVVIAVAADFLLRVVLLRIVQRLVAHTKNTWDDVIFNDIVLRRLCHIITPILLFALLPIAFPRESEALRIVMRLLQVYIVVMIFRFVNTAIRATFEIIAERPGWHDKPIKGLRQTAQGITLLICTIFIISILINKSPAILLTGLGASAAIVLLIFRDSILGFVSGIQLSANDMVKVGDWISMPKYGADGTVEEVSLNTVKIRNFDNTIVTVPPYLLVSDSFQNWRAMQLSGGRRVKRSVYIDMNSVQFCTPEMLANYARIGLLKEYIERTQRSVEEYNTKLGLDPDAGCIDGRHQTNLGVFRAYLLEYLRSEVRVKKEMTLMVRQLQPTEIGIPIELYFFTNTVDWLIYEGIQSDVFDHVLAVIPKFDLRVFQNISGADLRQFKV